jgi:sterol desaturase/sphingolipid hydroxylase (fatty acid hydroxylase superfamily)
VSDLAENALPQHNRRGNWRPTKLIAPPPLYAWPPKPFGIAKWLFGFPGYLWPWNALYAAIATLTWLYATPDMARTRTFSTDWVVELLLRDLALLTLYYGAWHLRLYVFKSQGLDYKYTGRWQPRRNTVFLFRSQIWDNLFWTLASALPIWTAWEAVTLWGQANGYLPYVGWDTHPLWCAALMLLIPLWREAHFYLIHRLLHWPPLYRAAHSLHHKNVDPGPWSGLAMHPIEHVLYFSGVLLHWLVPSNGLHVVFHLQHLALAPAKGHAGFEKLRFGETAEIATGNYMHYLHHRYFEVNYGSDLVPIDKWVGTFHDGSEAAEQEMNARLRRRRERAVAKG